MAHGDITHLEIPVGDLSRATDFYSKVFGWQIAEAAGYEGYPMWQAPNGVSGGALTAREDGFTQPRSVIEVDSIDETLALVQELGGTVTHPKGAVSESSWYAVFVDADGNSIGLFEGEM
ncbi:VOC family protein [Agrococcus sp. Marseille-P2731]|uniref:VOC family protein n=1 Tax=Agrococcus sp. Marseille-P2731 TaxID=1841862 RepID=UPI00092FDE75|nr:VOC family protein [Agrococcus sp. Marseille-P2731]